MVVLSQIIWQHLNKYRTASTEFAFKEMALKKFWHKYFKMIKINTIKPREKLSCGRNDILSSVWSLGDYFMSGGKGSNHSNSNPGGQTVKLMIF